MFVGWRQRRAGSKWRKRFFVLRCARVLVAKEQQVEGEEGVLLKVERGAREEGAAVEVRLSRLQEMACAPAARPGTWQERSARRCSAQPERGGAAAREGCLAMRTQKQNWDVSQLCYQIWKPGLAGFLAQCNVLEPRSM